MYSHPGNTSIDYAKPSPRRYGPTASSAQVPSTASLLPNDQRNSMPVMSQPAGSGKAANSGVSDGWGWNDPEADDYLHNPDPKRDLKNGCSVFTARGIMNVGCLFLLLVGLIALFAGYPIITNFTQKKQPYYGAFNIGGTNGSGQVADIPGFPDPIDPLTPPDKQQWTNADGIQYNLVFSDEFERDGRTFFPGDDPFWTAVDLHYWPTGDLEWYDPSAITTEGGHLKISMTQEPLHDLNFKSGMLQSWNQMCFQYSYYMEVSASLPGDNRIGGFWPGIWTMGNLGRPGYGATTDGMWPYTYDSCDTGTLPNQTFVNQTGPNGALTSGDPNDNGALSYLPGQRCSSCTCKGEDHPGPDVSVGRGVPEIDIIEAQIDTSLDVGLMSQSAQVAPFDDSYQFNNKSPAATIYDSSVTHLNTYLGGVFQQAISGLSKVPNSVYQGTNGKFNIYGVDVWADKKDRSASYITWYSSDQKTWQIRPEAMPPRPAMDIGQRLITEEPMAMILNFGMSNNFQAVDLNHLVFPNHMLIDYVRVYQRPEGVLGCDPPDHPTAKYIEDHKAAYSNANLTTWKQAGYTFPRQRLIDKCT